MVLNFRRRAGQGPRSGPVRPSQFHRLSGNSAGTNSLGHCAQLTPGWRQMKDGIATTNFQGAAIGYDEALMNIKSFPSSDGPTASGQSDPPFGVPRRG